MEVEGEKKKEKTEVEDSSDDDVDPARPTPLTFKLDFIDASLEGKKLAADKVFVGIWGVGALYLQALAKNHFSQVARVNFNKSKQRALCTLYYVTNEKSNFVLIFNDDLPGYSEVNFSEFLFSLFDLAGLKKIVTLHSVHRTSFASLDLEAERKLKAPFLRHINTAKAKKSNEMVVTRELEEAVALDGVAADLLVYSEINNVNADTYVAIIEESELTVEEVKKFDSIKLKYKFLQAEVSKQEYASLIKSSNITLFSKKMYI